MVSVVGFFFNGFRRGRKTLFMVSVAGFWVDSAAAGGSTILECIERLLVFFCVFRTGFRRWFFHVFRRGRKTFVYVFRRWFLFMVSVVARNVFFYGFRRCLLLIVSGCYRTAAVSPMETLQNHQDVSVTN